MLFPLVSVTVIGLIAGLIFVAQRKSQPARTLLLGLAGAWIGFMVGALIGVVIDVVALTGIYVAILGHFMAIVGASAALLRFPKIYKTG